MNLLQNAISVQKRTSALVCLIVLNISVLSACAQATNDITDVEPNTLAQGTTDIVTFTLGTGTPPAPPAGVLPNSITIGNASGTAATHDSQYIITATFNIPANESVGTKDATITFVTPDGNELVFTASNAFTVIAGVDMPPSISQHPQTQAAPPGSAATFTVIAAGTDPLSYQWQKDSADIANATDSTYTINPITEDDAGNYRCVVTNDFGTAPSNEATLTVAALTIGDYPIVDTGQANCYDNTATMTCPNAGESFHGQDATYAGNKPSYALSSDGLCVFDNVTGLTWQQSPDTNRDGDIDASDKLTWPELQTYAATLNAENYGGYNDWRLPTIKELYSLIDFRGQDPSACETEADCPGLTPYINTDYFDFAYGDVNAGERVIDSQYASSTLYVSTVDDELLFGVNFADGRIKGYWLIIGPSAKTFLVICVRGNTDYGINNFVDNSDGTITDLATGLMWQQNDSTTGMLWEDAIDYAENLTDASYSDWRLPNIKELQSLIDYTRSPDTTSSAAIDPLINVTSITNEEGVADYPYFWGSTTHATYPDHGQSAGYVAFGRGLGYMNGSWRDVHGAGCQRSDPKIGDPADYPTGHGPQGDAVRIYNYVRCVRDVDLSEPEASYEGYNLFTPLNDTNTYLMDNDGDNIHTWGSNYKPGNAVYLLENGRLLRTGNANNSTFDAGGAGGVVQNIEWCGNVAWEYTYSSDQHLQHHDIAPLPNGNVLILAWEFKTEAEAVAAGRNPALLAEGALWPDTVIEVQPTGSTSGEIVWQWKVWDHLVQDYDATKDNFGIVADHPERINLNYASTPGADWNHTNSIDYNAELDQILLSVRNFSEIWVIDHSVADSDILYRWGNPQTYDAGDTTNQQLFVQHDAEWITAGLPGEGDILIFNNGQGRSDGNYSSVDQITPPVDSYGNYTLASRQAYGPTNAHWTYVAPTPSDFYAMNISGAQRLANGNTLICDGPSGYFFEVTPDGNTVWDYTHIGNVFRVDRYEPDYAGILSVNGNPTDLDDDGDVDIDDVVVFESCATGPDVPLANPACKIADFDGDNDVDQSDFGELQIQLGMSGVACE